MIRTRVLAVGGVATVGIGALLFSLLGERSVIEAPGGVVVQTSAPPQSQAAASFQLRNGSSEVITPVVHHASCTCVDREFVPPTVNPGESFEFRVRARTDAYGTTARNRYRIGIKGDSRELVLTWVVTPDRSRFLLVSPVLVTAIEDGSAHSEFVLDANYKFDGAEGRPERDLSLHFESALVARTSIAVERRHDTDVGFSGRVRIRVSWTGPSRPRKLSGKLTAGPLERQLTLQWGEDE